MKLWHKALVLISIPLFFEFTLGALLAHQIARTQEYGDREAHARYVLSILMDFYKIVDHCVWMLPSTRLANRAAVHIALSDLKQLPVLQKALHDAFAEDSSEAPAIRQLDDTFATFMGLVRSTALAFQRKDILTALSTMKLFNQPMDGLLEETQALTNHENIVCNQLLEQKEAAKGTTNILLAVGLGLNVILACALLLFFDRSTMLRLTNVLNNVSRIARQQKPLPPVRGKDEFALLDAQLFQVASQLLKQRQRERAIIEECPALIFSLAKDGKLTNMNWLAKQTLLRESSAETQPALAALLIEEDKPLCKQFLQEPPAATFQCEMRVPGQAGESITLIVCGLWCAVENCWFCVAEDVTAEKQAQERRRAVSLMVNHDLRTPLTSILLSYEMGKTAFVPDSDPNKLALLGDAHLSGSKMLQLINNLLDLERITAGKFEILQQPAKLLSLLEEAKAEAAAVVSAANLAVAIDCPQDISLFVDGNSIARAISTILFVAGEHARPGSQVRIAAASQTAVQEAGLIVEFTTFGALPKPEDMDVEISLCEQLISANAGTFSKTAVNGQIIISIRLPLYLNSKQTVGSHHA